jgi:hypothetical protein
MVSIFMKSPVIDEKAARDCAAAQAATRRARSGPHQRDVRFPGLQHAQGLSGPAAEVKDATARMRAAIVDSHLDLLPGIEAGAP